jgi:hypothetical protein
VRKASERNSLWITERRMHPARPAAIASISW